MIKALGDGFMMVENHACCSLAEEMLWKMRHLNHIPSSRLKKAKQEKGQ